MDATKIPLLSMISDRMNWLNQRQKLLSQNIANADTPNFSASDLKAEKFSDILSSHGAGGFRLATTNPMHFSSNGTIVGAAGGGGGRPPQVIKRKPDETSINNNTVQLEDEMMKVSETQTDYNLMVNIYKKQIGLLRMALGRRQ